MPQYLFFTESYPFTCNLSALLADPEDRAILISKDVHRALAPYQAQCFRQIVAVETFDLESLDRALRREVSLEAGARLVSHDDSFYEIFAELSVRHGFRGFSPEAIGPFVNKHETKRRLQGSGIDLPKYVVFDEANFRKDQEEYVRSLGRHLGYPIFAKPLQGAGAEGSAFIRDEEELRSWCGGSKDEPFEIDEFIGEAALYHCDSVIRDGSPIFTQTSRYFRPCAEFVNGFPVASYTLRADDPVAQELAGFAREVINALGSSHPVPDGVTHMEMFRTEEGRIIFLEVQHRPPGANVKMGLSQHMDFNLEEVHFRLQMGKELPVLGRKDLHGAWIYFPTERGLVDKIMPLPNINSEIVMERWFIQPGQKMSRPTSILDAQGRGFVALSVVIRNRDHDRLAEDFERLCRHRPFQISEAPYAYN